MIANKQQIQKWFEDAPEGVEFMIVVNDTFDHSDYPVYASSETFDSAFEFHNGVDMQKIMEIYKMSLPIGSQLKQHRVRYFPVNSKYNASDIKG